MPTLQIDVPHDMLTLPDQTAETLAMLAREALIVRLYDQDVVSSGWAAQTVGLSRREFLDLLGQYGVSEFEQSLDVAAEVRRASAARDIDYQSLDEARWRRVARSTPPPVPSHLDR